MFDGFGAGSGRTPVQERLADLIAQIWHTEDSGATTTLDEA